jgi:hypothetical protein
MKVNKKGASLAFVIVVVLALFILSSALCAAAARSISLTKESTDGREAYLKAKSAIEYAKTQFYLNAESGNCSAFSVVPSGDGFSVSEARSPDGTSCLAECSSTDNGQTWKITAKAKYRNSNLFRTLSYSFRLTLQRNKTVTGFLSAGGKLGDSEYISSDGQFENPADYPIVVMQSVYTSQSAKAPEMYFINPKAEYCFKTKGSGSYNLGLTARLLYFDGTIKADPPAPDSKISLTLHGMADGGSTLSTGYAGLVYFHKAKVECRLDGTTFPETGTLNGMYYFRENTDLFDKSSYFGYQLVPVPQADQRSEKLTLGGKTLAEYYAGVQYIDSIAEEIEKTKEDVHPLLDAKQAGWLHDTKFTAGSHSNPESDVFIYTDSRYYDDWMNVHSASISYRARSILLLKQAWDTTIKIPDASVNFQTGTFWFCAQQTASYPWAASSVTVTSPAIKSSVPYDVPCIAAATENSKCFLNSPDDTDVTLILPRGLAIKPSGAGEYLLLPAGTYSVPSGTDLLTLPADWTKLKKEPESPDGSYAGVSITPLGYSNS